MKSALAWLLLAFATAFAVQSPTRVFAEPAEEAKLDLQSAMKLLKSKAAALGTPNVKGEEEVAGEAAPAIYFGATEMNNNFALVDDVQKAMGSGEGTATIFVKSGDEFVRVATNVKQRDGSRAIGTVLDPKGKAIAAIKKGESFFGVAAILGLPYSTGYEPIRNAGGDIIGVYYVGYRTPIANSDCKGAPEDCQSKHF